MICLSMHPMFEKCILTNMVFGSLGTEFLTYIMYLC